MKSMSIRERLENEVFMYGGVSYWPKGKLPETGYLVSLGDGQVNPKHDYHIGEKIWKDAIKMWQIENNDVIFGGWLDNETKKVYYDLNIHFKDRHQAIVTGKYAEQIAIWDIKNQKEIRL